MSNWVEGEWYFRVRCKACGVEFAFLRDGETTGDAYFTDSGKIVLACPDCAMPFAYLGEEIRRFQAK